MTRTRDVDFLLAALTGEALALERALIYRYRSGALRQRVRCALQKIGDHQDRPLTRSALPLCFGFAEEGLIPGLRLYDWPAHTTKGLTAAKLADSLTLLAASAHLPSVHFVPHDSVVTKYQGWRVLEESALVLEEPLITPESLLPALRYLAMVTDLASGADFLAQPGFVESFAELTEEHAGLPEIIQAFDERVLLCTDSATDRFDPELYRRDRERRLGRRALLPRLRDLAALRREDDLVNFLCGVDERRAECSWTAFGLVTKLYRITGALLEPSTSWHQARSVSRSRVAAHRVEAGSLLWAALLLGWEENLSRSVHEDTVGYRRGPDLLVPTVAALGRDFLTRELRTEAGDPLAGRWSAIARTLGLRAEEASDDRDDRLATARGHLVRGLAGALARARGERPDWIRRLHAQVLASLGRVDPCACRDDTPEKPGTDPACPRTFEAVIGRQHAVDALRRRARRKNAGDDLLLYGPEGVGKRTLARVYARAVLCDTPSPSGSACGACTSCRNFDAGTFGLIELDGAKMDIEASGSETNDKKKIETRTSRLVEAVKSRLHTINCVVIIQNADQYPPEAFDALLRTMETNERTSFVLLARSKDDVRVAGQSRCFDYCVRPLDRSEAEAFVCEVLDARGLTCNDATISLLIDAGGGLPSRLLKACEIVADTMPASVDAIRTKLDLGWAEGLVPRWPAIVAGVPSALADLMRSSGTDRAEQARRIRAVLQLIYLRGVQAVSPGSDAIDSALRHLDDRSSVWLATAVDQQAIEDGTTRETIWLRMVETWMSDWLSSE